MPMGIPPVISLTRLPNCLKSSAVTKSVNVAGETETAVEGCSVEDEVPSESKSKSSSNMLSFWKMGASDRALEVKEMRDTELKEDEDEATAGSSSQEASEGEEVKTQIRATVDAQRAHEKQCPEAYLNKPQQACPWAKLNFLATEVRVPRGRSKADPNSKQLGCADWSLCWRGRRGETFGS